MRKLKASDDNALPFFKSLPPDNFGVHVENEMDERRLLWLVNQIGEKKLRISAGKRNKYYPDSKLFVSVILKRFHLKVPVSVYAEVNVPIYRVYILVLCDHSAVKIGMTGTWPSRAYAFVKTADYAKNFDDDVRELFDENQSIAFDAGSEADARLLEKAAKQLYSKFQAPSPYHRGLIPYGCGGHKEWFDYSIYDDLVRYLSTDRSGFTLATAMTWRSDIGRSDHGQAEQ
ncbi:MAG TPA: hypothetical protein VF472_10260 [Burkholderiaceae bacterium]